MLLLIFSRISPPPLFSVFAPNLVKISDTKPWKSRCVLAGPGWLCRAGMGILKSTHSSSRLSWDIRRLSPRWVAATLFSCGFCFPGNNIAPCRQALRARSIWRKVHTDAKKRGWTKRGACIYSLALALHNLLISKPWACVHSPVCWCFQRKAHRHCGSCVCKPTKLPQGFLTAAHNTAVRVWLQPRSIKREFLTPIWARTFCRLRIQVASPRGRASESCQQRLAY